jgi:hypothetical protein
MREIVIDENGNELELAETYGPLSVGEDVQLADGRFAEIIELRSVNSGELRPVARPYP